ncbi:MAG: hypothetical protein OXH15_09730 [Gammaproteobacteria bacterium]|nr:hypothetical protein [Gammaproteobacteria bacterium]
MPATFVRSSGGLIALAALVVASGCVIVSRNHEIQEVRFSEPPIGAVATVGIGESLLKEGMSIEIDAIHLTRDVPVSLACTVRSGTYTKDGETRQGAFYSPSRHGDPGKILRAPLSDPVRAVHVPARSDRICVVDMFNLKWCKKGQLWLETTQLAVSDRAFQQQLIYNGIHAGRIRIGYHESSPSVTRPAFNTEVEYDLAQSNLLTYKGARVEVLDASPESITFRVLSHFD